MTPHLQTIMACPERRDGHDADGVPGNCLQAAVASMLDLPLDEVPHFGDDGGEPWGWWKRMRRWAREHRDQDWGWVPADDHDLVQRLRESIGEWVHPYVIASGDSPRGPFKHVVVYGADLTLVHDPHPSGAGLANPEQIEGYFVLQAEPYDPGPDADDRLADDTESDESEAVA